MANAEILKLIDERDRSIRDQVKLLQVSLGMRPAESGQTPGQGTPEDVKKAVFALSMMVQSLSGEIKALHTKVDLRDA